MAEGGDLLGRDRLRFGGRNPAGLAYLPAAGQHRPPRPRRGVGDDGQPGDAGPLRGRLRGRHCQPATAEEARRRIEATLAGLGLRLHPDKTRIVFLGGGEDGFDFLGFHHRKTPSKWGDRRYLSKWPSTRAMASIRAKVRDRTDRRFASRDLRDVVADLNPVLRGWSAYFRNGNSGRRCNAVDGYVHERLAIFASRKHRLRGRNWTTRFTYGWISRLGVYRLTGNVHRATAHASR
jgi:RNA-directed DNA polymerase